MLRFGDLLDDHKLARTTAKQAEREIRRIFQSEVDGAVHQLIKGFQATLPLSSDAIASIRRILAQEAIDLQLPSFIVSRRILSCFGRQPIAAPPALYDDSEISRLLKVSSGHLRRLVENRLNIIRDYLETALARVARHRVIEGLGVPISGGIRNVRRLGEESHNGAKFPLLIELTNGRLFVYKPVSLTGALAWRELVLLMARQDDAWLNVRTARVVPASDQYGFMEYLGNSKSSLSEAQIQTFFYSAGLMLSLAYAVNATDFHMDNILAVPSSPVAIDLETVFYRFEPGIESEGVLLSGLVQRQSVRGYRSGLQGGGRHFAIAPYVEREQDHEHVSYRKLGFSSANRLADEGVLISPLKYQAQILAGFEAGYRVISGNRDAILKHVEEFDRRNEIFVRHLVRFTAYYALQLMWLRQLTWPSEAQARLISTLNDVNGFLVADRCRDWIVEAEIEDLIAGDVPYFRTSLNRISLHHHRRPPLEGYFPRTAVASLGERLAGLGPSDFRKQLDLLRTSLWQTNKPPNTSVN